MKNRLAIITIFILLFIGTVVIIGSALMRTTGEAWNQHVIEQNVVLPSESGSFDRAHYALYYENMPEGTRTMSGYYFNRAYPGAPPSIPHPVLSAEGIGGKNCLQCHSNGGYTPQFNAYAPVTPHPEWLNCLQCHVPTTTNAAFSGTNWSKPPPPRLGIQALSTSPIVMPHGLQGRENCLSCHAGPAAPKEIRVTHPDRINCRQCHVPPVTESLFYTIAGEQTPVDKNSINILSSDSLHGNKKNK